MKNRRLGRTNFEVSALGVGGHVYPIGNSSDDFCTPDQRAGLIKHLVDAGVNYFDTTWMNEVELLADSISRAQITTPLTVSLQLVDGVSDSKWREKLRPELERRLEIMEYPRAPLFIMGVGNGHPKPSEIRAAAHAMRDLQSEGLIQNIGLSCHDFAAFETIASIIEEDDCLDYLMIRYNWKFPRAAERLFPVARSKDVGLVAMKALCWDCGIEDWARRISVFEPLDDAGRASHFKTLNAAQNSLLWCLQACDTSAVSINARWEADQLLQAVNAEEIQIDTGDFARFKNRLHDKTSLLALSQRAESAIIRERSASLL
ncbi:putative oxidoreductase [Abditibacterium utsteinense]|uniref:Putative oxidoreductase n=1 Tax=Abditibacterium utsteinense TaxID=1960156 RepID=A0A2S8SRE9_9BACT|nr:aldo/keto reductase [Abditibacterium utsteinense]PQV63383.1 putative oxidoreductase [Abditibacterium utsteinense]